MQEKDKPSQEKVETAELKQTYENLTENFQTIIDGNIADVMKDYASGINSHNKVTKIITVDESINLSRTIISNDKRFNFVLLLIERGRLILTVKIAVTGKSGSGKTTLTKALLNVLRTKFPEKTFLLFDNDLSGELGHTFGKDIRNTIYGIRSGKHEYKTGIPQHMTKQEYVEWAIEDIIVQLEDNVDIIVSWLSGVKDCRCPITEQINDALQKLIERYDFVIFDCEFDLKYLNQLVDVEIEVFNDV